MDDDERVCGFSQSRGAYEVYRYNADIGHQSWEAESTCKIGNERFAHGSGKRDAKDPLTHVACNSLRQTSSRDINRSLTCSSSGNEKHVRHASRAFSACARRKYF